MFQRLILLIRDEFGVSRSQARGLLVIAFLMLVCWFAPLLYDKLTPAENVKMSDSDIKTADSLLAILAQVSPKNSYPTYEHSSNSFAANHNPEQPLVLFYFDPNTASVAELQELGMPKFIAERIIKYRSKGGKFRQREDLQKIYGLQPALYERLEPYISIANATNFATNAIGKTPKEEVSALPNTPNLINVVPKTPKITTFDINTVDTTQLIKLKGIGSKLAARIVKFRDGLGGFTSTAQYAEVFGLDSLALSELQQYAQVRTPAKKISINTASAEELDRHPYLSRRQAEIIIRYREQHGAYTNSQDLLKIKILDEKTVNKLMPYLAF